MPKYFGISRDRFGERLEQKVAHEPGQLAHLSSSTCFRTYGILPSEFPPVAAQEGWRWLQARGFEVHVFHSTSVAV